MILDTTGAYVGHREVSTVARGLNAMVPYSVPQQAKQSNGGTLDFLC